MAAMEQIVTRYLDTFNETDPAERRDQLARLWHSDSTYTDPHVDLRGPEQVDQFIASTQARFPGYKFRLGGEIDTHHNQARFQWHAGPADRTEPIYVGFDVLIADGDRVDSVYGFLDVVPSS